MKVLNICQTPLLSCEVEEVIKSDPRNTLAFSSDIDPLENPEISDSDELRRLVASRRVCEYFKNNSTMGEINRKVLPEILSILSSHGFSRDMIVRMVDCAVLFTGDMTGLYMELIQQESESQKPIITLEQLDQIKLALQILIGKQPVLNDMDLLLRMARTDKQSGEDERIVAKKKTRKN